MATLAADVPIVEEAPAVAESAPAGDPTILGLPIFVVGSIALGLSLVGYVPATAGGVIVPVIFAATGLGLVIATVWAAALGQTMVASIFGLFAGFWLSFSVLELGLLHNWLLVPAASVNKSIALFLISWAVVIAALTVGSLRLPAAFSIVLALVVVALVLRTIGVLDTSDAMNKAAGYVVLVFAALGVYLFLNAADLATGGRGLPLGAPMRK
ncbi:MAG TPA: GPR1/FUN34/YaaH family transporter [Solirubrobacteraceae bacterium]